MADNNLSAPAEPVVTTPPTETQLIEDISNLLEDPETDPPEEPEDDTAADAEPEDDPLGLDVEAEDVGADEGDDNDGPDDAEVKGGRFAPDSAKVKLENGETITIADLKVRVDKRVKDFQRDHTQKSQALAAEKAEVDQYAQSLSQAREYLAWYAEQQLPQQPTPPADPNDYVAWHNYRLEADRWAAHQQAYQQFQADKQAEEKRREGETQKQAQERYKREAEALLMAMPVLKDPVKGPVAWSTLISGASEHYGISAEEVNALRDHRQLKVLRDALAFRRIKAKAPQVQAEVAQKPAMKTGRRAPPTTTESKGRQARSERLRSEGSFEAGVAALQDFDL